MLGAGGEDGPDPSGPAAALRREPARYSMGCRRGCGAKAFRWPNRQASSRFPPIPSATPDWRRETGRSRRPRSAATRAGRPARPPVRAWTSSGGLDLRAVRPIDRIATGLARPARTRSRGEMIGDLASRLVAAAERLEQAALRPRRRRPATRPRRPVPSAAGWAAEPAHPLVCRLVRAPHVRLSVYLSAAPAGSSVPGVNPTHGHVRRRPTSSARRSSSSTSPIPVPSRSIRSSGSTARRASTAGRRGRMFLIRGILIGSTLQDLNAAESVFQNYADGVARTLVDPRGRTWPNVIFRGEIHARPPRALSDLRRLGPPLPGRLPWPDLSSVGSRRVTSAVGQARTGHALGPTRSPLTPHCH